MNDTLRILKLFWAEDRRNVALPIVSALAMPLAVAYLATRLGPGGKSVDALGLTIAFGGAAVQVGSAVLEDRFSGRLGLLRTLPVRSRSYLAARLGLGLLEALGFALVALLVLQLVGRAILSPAALAWAVLSVAATGAGLCGIGAAIALRAPDADSGWTLVSVVLIGLALVSPVLYPESAVPAALRPILWLSPYTHAPPQLRAVLAGQAPPAFSLIGSAVLAVGFNLLAVRSLRW